MLNAYWIAKKQRDVNVNLLVLKTILFLQKILPQQAILFL